MIEMPESKDSNKSEDYRKTLWINVAGVVPEQKIAEIKHAMLHGPMKLWSHLTNDLVKSDEISNSA